MTPPASQRIYMMNIISRVRFSIFPVLLGGHPGWAMPPVEDPDATLSQVAAEMVEEEGTVTAEVEGRIRMLD